MSRTVLICSCLVLTLLLPACAGMDGMGMEQPGMWRIDGSMMSLFAPSGYGPKAFIPFLLNVGREMNIANESMAYGVFIGHELTAYLSSDVDFYADTGTLDVRFYPFTRVDEPGFKPFLSVGINKAFVRSSPYYPRRTHSDADFQAGVGFHSVQPDTHIGFFATIFWRNCLIKVNPSEDEVWTMDERQDMSGWVAEVGVTWQF